MRYKCLFFIVIALQSLAWAHPLDVGFVQAKINGKEVVASIDLNPAIVANLLDVEQAKLTPQFIAESAEKLMRLSLGGGKLTYGDGECAWAKPGLDKPNDTTVRVHGVASCSSEGAELRWEFPFLRRPGIPSTFQILVKAEMNGAEKLHTGEPGKDVIVFSVEKSTSLGEFVWMGVEHIGAAPSEWKNEKGFHLPDGIDHILFLLALILCGGTLMEMIKTATGFTVGHSITLAIASLNIFTIPSRIIEPAIALSIAYVAAEAAIIKKPRQRWYIALAFGLVHGFGFANALTELNLKGATLLKALFGYNLGVELGQVFILLIIFPVVTFMFKQPALRKYAVPGCASVIFCAGAFWFVQRAFGF